MNVPNVALNGKTVISLFAGCGGSSLGYQMAGFKELLAVEWNDNAVETFKLNFPDIPVYHGDICNLTGNECMNLARIKKGKLDILDGSPPCQGFSLAGKRKFTDPRNSLFKEYVRLLHELQPKVFVMENVTGMIKGVMKQAYLQIIEALRKCGYKANGEVLNAMYYGVPQSRERVIIIGVREDLGIEPSHPQPQIRPITVREAFKNLPNQDNEIKKLNIEKFALYNKIKKLKQGECLTKYYSYGFNTARLNWDKSSRTITRGMEHISSCNGLIHPEEHRKLTLLELKRLSSFPDNFKFTDWKNGWHRIGNSVPPLLMKVIAEHIRDNILN